MNGRKFELLYRTLLQVGVTKIPSVGEDWQICLSNHIMKDLKIIRMGFRPNLVPLSVIVDQSNGM